MTAIDCHRFNQQKDKASSFDWDEVIPILTAKESQEYTPEELNAYKNTVLQCRWFDPSKSNPLKLKLGKETTFLNLNQVVGIWNRNVCSHKKIILEQNHVQEINALADKVSALSVLQFHSWIHIE